MKIRSDFVTNSSSSSFILAFESKEDGLCKIAKMAGKYGSDYVCQLLKDFEAEHPIPYENLSEHLQDDLRSCAYYEMNIGSGGWWSSDKDTFEKRWMDAHPGADYRDYIESDEFKQEEARLMKKAMDEILNEIGSLRYLVELEYEDHSEIGCALEHDILPNCDFTIKCFNHH